MPNISLIIYWKYCLMYRYQKSLIKMWLYGNKHQMIITLQNHFFNECQFFSTMFMLLFRRLNISMMMPYHDSTQEIILNRAIRKEIREVMAIACFVVCRERCNRIFREKNKTVAILIEEVKWSPLNKRGIR
jgi:hypothetical protein